MAVINPYLNFNGNTEEAFNFYKSVFGGEFAMVMRFKDAPPSEHTSAAGDGEKIMHISFPLGTGTILMGSDVPAGFPAAVTGTNFSISVSADSREDADKIFGGLAAGGNAAMPMADTFWGSYFGMLVDKFGINWMVSHDPQRS